MKIKDILNSKNVLVKLNNTAGMSSIVAYRVGKNIKLLDDELKPYDDARTKVLEEAANKDENGKAIIDEATRQYDIPEDKLQEALQEIEKLQDEDINVDVRKVTVEDINKAELVIRTLKYVSFYIASGWHKNRLERR